MVVEGVDIKSFINVANNDKYGHGFSCIQKAKIESKINFVRWDKILDAAKNGLNDEAFGWLLHILWQTYSNGMDGKIMYDLFMGANKKYLMDENEQKIFDNLPDRVFIYRGSQDISKGTNISWSLSHERAEWFGRHILVKEEVEKSIIAAYFNREQEVICPPDLFAKALEKIYR